MVRYNHIWWCLQTALLFKTRSSWRLSVQNKVFKLLSFLIPYPHIPISNPQYTQIICNVMWKQKSRNKRAVTNNSNVKQSKQQNLTIILLFLVQIKSLASITPLSTNSKLLLSIYHQLCVVQYGEFGRWSLVWVKVKLSILPTVFIHFV